MPFTAADLIHNDYLTDIVYAVDDPRTSGDLDDTAFNRRSQSEVLYLINHCYKSWRWPEYAKASGRKLEALIRSHIPRDLNTQREIIDWIGQNWKHYWYRLSGK